MTTASIAHVLSLSDSLRFSTYSSHFMTATIARSYTLLGEIFDYDELQDIAQYGAMTGVHGFIYSSELYDVWVNHSEDIESYLEDFANSCLISLGKLWSLIHHSSTKIPGLSTTA